MIIRRPYKKTYSVRLYKKTHMTYVQAKVRSIFNYSSEFERRIWSFECQRNGVSCSLLENSSRPINIYRGNYF